MLSEQMQTFVLFTLKLAESGKQWLNDHCKRLFSTDLQVSLPNTAGLCRLLPSFLLSGLQNDATDAEVAWCQYSFVGLGFEFNSAFPSYPTW